MVFPLWAIFGLCNAVLSASTMLMQEKFKLNGFVLAFWNKIACITLLVPCAIYYGLPHEPRFYLLMLASAGFYAINDVIFFRHVPNLGAGTISRIIPASVVFSFLLWFAVNPSTFGEYLQKPAITGLIFLVLCIWVYFATHLRKCAVSMKAARTLWFVLLTAVIGPVVAKETTSSTDVSHGLYGYPFVQALMMVTAWCFFFAAKKPVSTAQLFSRKVWPYGMLIGCINGVGVVLGAAALYHVDNPAYTSAMGYLNSFFILLAYAIMGRKNDGNVIAGLGMVACATALIILKAQIP